MPLTEFLLLFAASYGLCFGLMNGKAKLLTTFLIRLPILVKGEEEEKTTFFLRMLTCPYCTGFHTGWMSWLLVRLSHHVSTGSSPGVIASEIVSSAFASASLCYLLDTGAQATEDVARAANAMSTKD